jgi:PKD repeat protein
MLLLLMVAIDFGRVYLGWINLQNMARIAANYAANNADKFQANDSATSAKWLQQILNDAAATNCRIHNAANQNDKADPPAFSGYTVGSSVSVSLNCTFNIITPIISNALGSTVSVSASSAFPVKTGIIAATNTGGGGGGGGGGIAVTASFSCTPRSGAVTLTVQCNDESGGSPTSWSWTLTGPGGSQTSTDRDPVFAISSAGSYSVSLTADNALNQPSTFTRNNYISAATAPAVDFSATPVSGTAPLSVQFTDNSSGSPTAWAWDFDSNGTVDSTQQNPSFTYTTAGSKDVTLTVTNAAGSATAKKTAFIVVGAPNCNVPSFTGVKRNSAPGIWSAASFTGPLTNAPGAPNGNFTISFQSITPGSLVPCSSTIEVK